MNRRSGLLLFVLCSTLAVAHVTALPDATPAQPPVHAHTRLNAVTDPSTFRSRCLELSG